jgi:hypothetical protein
VFLQESLDPEITMDISNFSVGAVKSVAVSTDGKNALLDAIMPESR